MKFDEFKERLYQQGYTPGLEALQRNLSLLNDAIDNRNLEQLKVLLPYCNTPMLRYAEKRVGQPDLLNFEVRIALKHRAQDIEYAQRCIPIGCLTPPVIEYHGSGRVAVRYVI